MRIAFIGLGNMGGGMAANLLKAGRQVRAFDLSADAVAKAREHGAQACATVGEAVERAEAVVSMLPNGAIVESVYTGEVIGRAPADALLLDCSTIDVATARRVAEAAAQAGYAMVDAPVSGGIAAAAAGSLTFMVGGSDQAFARARPILAAMGKAVIHAGASGAGQAAKICNNMILAISMIGVGEAFALAEKLGLSHQALFDVASTSSGQCWALTSYCPVPGPVPASPANNGYKPGFASALMVKDLTLAQDAANAAGAATPLGKHAQEIYKAFDAAGHGGVDFSGIIQHVRSLAGK
jgi:3-hydroxyisobutyrate dehydrogenase